MKADPTGSPSEQCFARMGWVPPKEAKARGLKPCSQCHYFEFGHIPNGDGGASLIMRCFHLMTFGNPGKGQATKENASCTQWTMKEVGRG